MVTRFEEQSETYRKLLDELYDLFIKKGKDYGNDGDHFANIRASEEFGVTAWVGACIRMNDKVARIKTFVAKGELQNESVDDSLIDIAVYALNALTIRREDKTLKDLMNRPMNGDWRFAIDRYERFTKTT